MKDLDEKWEALIYDTYASLIEAAPPLCELVNEHGTLEQKAAYQSGIYAQATKLGVLLGPAALERGRQRHQKIDEEVKAAMAQRSCAPSRP